MVPAYGIMGKNKYTKSRKTGKDKIKLSLFTVYMIVYAENPKISPQITKISKCKNQFYFYILAMNWKFKLKKKKYHLQQHQKK